MAEVSEKRRKFPAKHGLDHELRAAKELGKTVKVFLAFDTDFTGSESDFTACVLWVDTYSVKFDIDGTEVWVNKAFIISVEV